MRIALALMFFASLLAAQSDVQAVPSCAAARIVIPQGAFATPIIVPSEANALNPTMCLRPQSRTTRPRIALSQRNATVPPIGIRKPGVAFRPINGFITPNELGPITRVRLPSSTECI